jgi:hypothetical protein
MRIERFGCWCKIENAKKKAGRKRLVKGGDHFHRYGLISQCCQLLVAIRRPTTAGYLKHRA